MGKNENKPNNRMFAKLNPVKNMIDMDTSFCTFGIQFFTVKYLYTCHSFYGGCFSVCFLTLPHAHSKISTILSKHSFRFTGLNTCLHSKLHYYKLVNNFIRQSSCLLPASNIAKSNNCSLLCPTNGLFCRNLRFKIQFP